MKHVPGVTNCIKPGHVDSLLPTLVNLMATKDQLRKWTTLGVGEYPHCKAHLRTPPFVCHFQSLDCC